MTATKPITVEEYIAGFPAEVQEILRQIRAVIKDAAPEAKEWISYGMPAYQLNGPLVYFAAFKNHIGLYALPSGHAAFEKELSAYKMGKGSVQFPLSQPMPMKLISRMVKFRAQENAEKSALKTQINNR